MTQIIEAKYRVVTPMFCGGADPSVDVEFRLPSFKGVLRFWWRALAWGQYGGDLKEIKKAEDRLLGSAESGQSRVSIRLSEPPETTRLSPPEVLRTQAGGSKVVGEGVRYLGYGVMEAFPSKSRKTRAGQLTRPCFLAPFDIEVTLRCHKISGGELKLLCSALKSMGLLGGLGAKSRKGFGSLVIQRLAVDGEEILSSFSDPEKLETAIGDLYSDSVSAGLPRYTAFCRDSRSVVLVGSASQPPLDLLDRVGREIVRFRSWGRNGKILGGSVNSEKNFKDDHDLMQMQADKRTKHPRRIVFGLPHNYGRESHKKVEPAHRDWDRRASPLFIHMHECGKTPVAVLSLLPAVFLPEEKRRRPKINVGGKDIDLAPEEKLYQPIHTFLDRLLDPNKRKEQFCGAMEVKP